MAKIISFGGGVNSVAMTIMLYKRGEIYPLVFADTMAEHPETYCYMDYFEREFLSKYGQKIVRVNPFDNAELYNKRMRNKSLEQYCLENKMIPLFHIRFCTSEFKRDPLQRYNKETHLIAFAWDERHRSKDNSKWDLEYPLIEERITRQGCIDIIQLEGLNIPRKSGCFFCPFQRIAEWENTWKFYPELFNRSLIMEENSKSTFRNDKNSLSVLRERFESKGGDLFPDYDYEELTPCMCIT
jgi:hypothetical protein